MNANAEGVLDIADLIPTADDLWAAAYSSTSGDTVVSRVTAHHGVHGRRRHDALDSSRKTKTDTWKAALAGDVSHFAGALQRLLSNRLPPSIRNHIKQRGKKAPRPIDDPSEDKRVVLSHFHNILEPRIEPHLHPGQYGGRRAGTVAAACQRDGASHLDHMAVLTRSYIREGYDQVLLVDLRKAFPRLARKAVVGALVERVGLTRKAADLIWEVVRIRGVDRRRGGKPIKADYNIGIEQGNNLSTMLLNLVLADVLFKIEKQLADKGGVKILVYVDDIYVFAKSPEVALEAHKLLRRLWLRLGMKNVPPIGSGKKDSQILDLGVESAAEVLVLKRYLVSGDRIRLTEAAIEFAREQAREAGLGGQRIGPMQFRKFAGCRAADRRWLRQSGVLMIPVEGSPARPLREGGGGDSTDGSFPAAPPPMNRPEVGWLEREAGEVPPTGGSSPDSKESREAERDRREAGAGGVPEHQAERNTAADSMSEGMELADGEPICGVVDEGPRGQEVRTPDERLCSYPGIDINEPSLVLSEHSPGQGRFYKTKGEGSPIPTGEAGNTRDRFGSGVGGQVEVDTPRPARRVLRVAHPEIAEFVRGGKKPQVDKNREEDAPVINLVGLDELLPAEGSPLKVACVVNGLLRLGRWADHVEVEWHPSEAWTVLPTVLGGADDPVYRRVDGRVVEGVRRAVLVPRCPRRRRERVVETGGVVVERVQRVDPARRVFRVRVVRGRRGEWLPVTVPSPGFSIGAVEAMAEVVDQLVAEGEVDIVITIPAVMKVLQRDVKPKNVGLAAALERLRANLTDD